MKMLKVNQTFWKENLKKTSKIDKKKFKTLKGQVMVKALNWQNQILNMWRRHGTIRNVCYQSSQSSFIILLVLSFRVWNHLSALFSVFCDLFSVAHTDASYNMFHVSSTWYTSISTKDNWTSEIVWSQRCFIVVSVKQDLGPFVCDVTEPPISGLSCVIFPFI